MPEQKFLNWKSILEQVLAGLVLAAVFAAGALVLARIKGFPLRQTVWRIFATAGEPVLVPFGILAPAIFVLAILAIALLRQSRDAKAAPQTSVASNVKRRMPLSPTEEKIILLFEKYDKEELSLLGMKESLQLSSLEYEDALHKLYHRDFAWPDRDGMYNRQRLVLLPAGRSWLLSNK